MDDTQRRAIEERAQQLWTEAGSPPGREPEFRARAAAELAGGEEAILQRSVDRAVPTSEQFPGRADDNPLSRHVEDVAEGAPPGPGGTTFEGGETVREQRSSR